jgi:hypothetical protein
MSSSSNIARSRIFQEITFYYNPQEPDFMELNNKIIAHGGHLTGFSHIAVMKLGRVPYVDGGDFYDAIYVDDCIAAGKLLDKDEYYISRLIGVAFVDSTLTYAERQLLHADRARVGLEPRRTPRESGSSPERSRSRSPRTVARGMSVLLAREPPSRPFREVPITRYEDPYIMRGREPYSPEDDMRILDFVHEVADAYQGRSATGTNLWEYAEDMGLIPGRTDQSMRGRYLKFLRPQYEEKRRLYVQWKVAGGSWRNPYK